MLENMKNKQKEWHTATKPFYSGLKTRVYEKSELQECDIGLFTPT
jgi:hypothetical protein